MKDDILNGYGKKKPAKKCRTGATKTFTKASLRKKLTAKLNKLWPLAIESRAGSKCEITGARKRRNKEDNGGKVLNAHHWYKSKGACKCLKWDPDNGVYIQSYYHIQAHNSGGWFMRRMEAVKGREWIEKKSRELEQKIQAFTGKFTLDELEEKVIILEKIIKGGSRG